MIACVSGQVFAVRAVALDQVGHGVQTEAVDADVEPELHHAPHGFEDGGIVVIQVGLMAEEAVPVIGFRNRVPGPIRHFRVEKNDAGVLVTVVGVAPDVPIALGIVAGTARLLKPRVLIGGVIETSSMMTRIPRSCAAFRNALKSSSEP